MLCNTVSIRALSVSKIYPYFHKSTKIYDQEIHGSIIAMLATAHAMRILIRLGSAAASIVVSPVAPYPISIHESKAIPVDTFRSLICTPINTIDAIISHKKNAKTYCGYASKR
jgi:hypothetical protein